MSAFILRLKLFHVSVIVCFFAVVLFHSVPAVSEENPEVPTKSDANIEDELKYLQEETYVITGTRIPQQIEKTSHSVFVVTDKEIQQMGARFLTDVIPIVPGWHIYTAHGRMDMMLSRGAGISWGDDILVMVNNLPFSSPSIAYRLICIENAKRIEFVSGPGSSSYGSNAMSGVINIITKEGKDIDGAEVTMRGGSFDTRQTNILLGKEVKDLEIALNFNYFETDGYDARIDEDEQTQLDATYGTSASLAPGDIKGDADKYDGQLSLAYKGFKFDGRYHNHSFEFPLGGRNILDDSTNHEQENYLLNLSYEFTLWEGFDLSAKVYRENKEFESFYQGFPQGSLILTPSGPSILAEPLYYKWSGQTEKTGFETQATYDISETNTFVAGFIYEETNWMEMTFNGNYIPTENPGLVIPIPTFQDWPDEYNWDPLYKRNFKAIFMEDVWDIRNNLRFDIGARYDHYSDFGGEFSPRAGLNWEFVENYFIKLNYGRAFRAPSFMELYYPDKGNDDLDPETEDTYELGFGVRFLPAFTGQITYFYRETKDSIISPYSGRTFNRDKTINRGAEIQLKYDFGRGSYLSVNYVQIDPDILPYIQPERMGNAVANWRMNRYLNWNVHCLYRGDWDRKAFLYEDPRDDLDDYVIVNTKLTVRQFFPGIEGLELGLSVFNLFDEEYYEPSTYNQGLPGDFPLPGRSYLVELRYVY